MSSRRTHSPMNTQKSDDTKKRLASQSPASSRSASRAASPASSLGQEPSKEAGWKKGLGFDPAKPADHGQDRGNTRMELPADAYVSDTKKSLFAQRGSKLNTEGKTDVIEVNQYRMTNFDFSKKIFQYDVAISPEPTKKVAVMKKIWEHSASKQALAKYQPNFWLFDGRKLAWAPCAIDRGEVRYMVDLDEGKQQSASGKKDSNTFYVTIRQSAEIKIAALQGYLDHKIQFNNTVQEALNFLDHLIREWPSKSLLSIKRNFYQKQGQARPLMDGTVVEVHKGAYASLRLSHNMSRGGIGLALNADVSNTCFWVGKQTIDQLFCNFLASCDRRWNGIRSQDLSNQLRPVRGSREGIWEPSEAFKNLQKLRKLKFTVRHPNRANTDKLYTVSEFVFNTAKFGSEGGTAKEVKFECEGKMISVADYYAQKYKAFLRYPALPLIDAGRGGFIPMEFAYVEPMQRYPFKLNPDQTAAMIKIAVTRPDVRKGDIQRQLSLLQHSNDPILRHYGAKFDTQFAKTEAKILPPPVVNFRQGSADPKFSGRWDLRGKKFWKANVAPLGAWGFVVLDNSVNLPQLQQFARSFKTAFLGHGGVCPQDALLLNAPATMRNDAAEIIKWAHEQITAQRGYTQLLFIVVQHKNSPHYVRVKKSADCRFGILSQVVNAGHVAKNNGQYHSNVCMKVNAKLGGATARTTPPWRTQQTFFPKERPTMIIGVDISHAAPGGVSASTAAMTMSIDRDATRYAAAVETNGYRTEMLTPSKVQTMFQKLSGEWKKEHDGQFPNHIFYFRDGVAEGQFAHVMEQEITPIKQFLSKVAPNLPPPKFTVIVATKRHHIRLFPQQGKGDRNGNALPGTLVEKEVTHPFMFDFYLNSHAAIQGTARPVHYHVLLDEMNVPVNDLQKMIYQQCYSYARSTTPVSLHPAVYYAHLAGSRARAHEAGEGIRAGGKGHEIARDREAHGQSTGDVRGIDAPPLLPLGGMPSKEPLAGEMRQREFCRRTMWYI